MAVPPVPAANAPLDVAWGQVVHEDVVVNNLQRGTATVVQSGLATATVDVTFPQGYASFPGVFLQSTSSSGTSVATVTNITTTGFRIVIHKTDGTMVVNNVVVNWLAYGQRL
jgi:hypothetical protein